MTDFDFAEIGIRPMQVVDLDKVMLVERAAYPIAWSRGVFEDCLAGKNICYVLELKGEVVGHAIISLILDETHLLNLCISPKNGRQGLGRYFLQHLVNEAGARESSVFFLEVRASNTGAAQLYFSEGFNEVGVRPNYYPAKKGREDAILMTLDLSIDQYV